jgi:hypothetical protein
MLAHVARATTRLRPFHHAAEHPVQLDQARRRARCLADLAERRDARHPDQRQLHPQRHRRSLGRRRRRRDRGSAPWAEIIRQWSTLHPEFSFLPRKFKIAVTARRRTTAPRSRSTTSACAASQRTAGEVGFEVYGRRRARPHALLGQDDPPFLPSATARYVEAILRVYNQFGRRDNIYKARIKILVHELGIEEIRAEVEAEWQDQGRRARAAGRGNRRIAAYFALSGLRAPADDNARRIRRARAAPTEFRAWCDNVVAAQGAGLRHRHDVAEARSAARRATPPPSRWTRSPISPTLFASAKSASATSRIWCCRMSRKRDLPALWRALAAIGWRRRNVNLVTDIIACPGLDYCASPMRARSRSRRISERFGDLARSATSAAEDQDFRLHQCLRPSSCRPYRHSRRREERRGVLPVRRVGLEPFKERAYAGWAYHI